MKRTSFVGLGCSVAQCLETVGDGWSMLIVRDAFFGAARFDDFQARLGIPRNTLTQRLEQLVDHEVLDRVTYQDNPPRHEYRLTEKGRDLWGVLEAMRTWGDRWSAPDGPPIEIVHKGCGKATHGVITCAKCGEPLGPDVVRARRGAGATDTTPQLPSARASR